MLTAFKENLPLRANKLRLPRRSRSTHRSLTVAQVVKLQQNPVRSSRRCGDNTGLNLQSSMKTCITSTIGRPSRRVSRNLGWATITLCPLGPLSKISCPRLHQTKMRRISTHRGRLATKRYSLTVVSGQIRPWLRFTKVRWSTSRKKIRFSRKRTSYSEDNLVKLRRIWFLATPTRNKISFLI